MAFDDLAEFFDDSLSLPIGGRLYRVPPPSAKVGLQVQAVVEVSRRVRLGLPVSDRDREALQLDDEQERSWYAQMLGTAFDEMVAAEVSWPMVQHAAGTVSVWITSGRSAAERFWAKPSGDGGGHGGGGGAGEGRPASSPEPVTSTP